MKNKFKGLIFSFIGTIFLGVSLLSLSANADNTPEIKKLAGSDRYATAVELSKKQFRNADTICIVNGSALADGLAITPLATYYKSPILLTQVNSLPQSTKDEIKRLNAKKAFIGGSSGVVSDNVIKELKSLGVKEIVRLGGADRYDTALEIAKYLDKNCFPVKEVVIAYGYGEPDSLSISSVAGSKQMAIILTPKDNLKSNAFEWLKSKKLTNAYIIGSDGVVSNKIMNDINSITSNDISNNRLGGKNRYETNAKVIERFFPNQISEVYIAKGWEGYLIDALSSGVISALNNAPVIILNNSSKVEPLQEKVLEPKSSNLVYEVGGGLNQNSVKRVSELLGTGTPTPTPNPNTGSWSKIYNYALSRGWTVYNNEQVDWKDNGSIYFAGGSRKAIGLSLNTYSDEFAVEIQAMLKVICPEVAGTVWQYIQEFSSGEVTRTAGDYTITLISYNNGQVNVVIYK